MLLSIITINYNNLNGLKRTVNSVLNQSFKEFEYIIIDGGSTDGSLEFILENKIYFNFWCSEKDSGIYNAMNKGIKASKGTYLFFLNSGDFLLNPNVFSNIQLSSDIEVFRSITTKDRILSFSHPLSLLNLLSYPIPHQATFYCKKVFGFYDDSYKIGADRKKNLQLYLAGLKFRFSDSIITFFDNSGISSNPEYFASKLVESKRIHHELFGKDIAEIVDELFLLKKKLFILKSSNIVKQLNVKIYGLLKRIKYLLRFKDFMFIII